MRGRWILKRALTGATLHTDAPITVKDAPVRSLSGAGSLQFSVSGAFAERKSDVDGLPLVQEWNTRIYKLGDDDRVLWGGIVIATPEDSPSTWTVEAATDSTVLFGTPYLGPARYLAKVDPADIVRTLVNHVQSQPDGDLGIKVQGSTTVRVGTFSTQNAVDATNAYNASVKAYNTEVAERKRLAAIVSASRKAYSALVDESQSDNAELSAAKKAKPKDQARINRAQAAVNDVTARKKAKNDTITTQQAAVTRQAKVVATAKAAKDRAYKLKVAATKAKKDDGGAFELLWWEAPDCGQTVQTLADDAPFDYLDEWTKSGDDITSTIHIYYPRVGRLRADIAFQQGVNVVDVIKSTVPGDDYASDVVGIGAGEGAKSIRRTTARRNGRIRRVAVVTDKDVKSNVAMDRRINRELASRQNVLEVQQLRVRGTRGVPFGSWQIGDDVPVQVTLKGHGPIDVLHRIVEEQPESDNIAVLTLKRSDSFIYGG
ncbi:hypothetical protein [Curtobacterium sp. VKM Ac-2884]|uniref:hypothetical protein n=1 Tax=Curtobacterium sp. VKM Ac-2884 TaxID=2783818 RepID=UPI00188B9CA6|nr:hypothetical protein [Curtobacterium sp. VKM Ac-2884]MBF4602841.1 hypothetical protein [Curtobacterium sp. VKM Ac-2884]